MLHIEHKHRDLANALHSWATASLTMAPPPNFGQRAWPAYLLAITRASYFFAVDELIAVCLVHDVSIAIFKEVHGRLTFVDGWFDGGERVVCTKLTANSSKSVRSHFERLLLASEWGQGEPIDSGASTAPEANKHGTDMCGWGMGPVHGDIDKPAPAQSRSTSHDDARKDVLGANVSDDVRNDQTTNDEALHCQMCEVSCAPYRSRKFEFEKWWDAAQTLAKSFSATTTCLAKGR